MAPTNGSAQRLCPSLSADLLRHILDYDQSTGLFTWKNPTASWIKPGDIAGHENIIGYISIKISGVRYQAHRLAWYYVYSHWTMIDHINTIKCDNRLRNLRPTTYQLNAANRGHTGANKCKGVYERGNGKFEAGIKVNQQRIYLGTFNSLEEAAQAYKEAATLYFGEHARED
jgi:HNH endonuclease/AP2 domain